MRLSGWKVPIETISASSLTSFISCPEAWRKRYIKKIPESFGIEKFVGIVDHGTHAQNFMNKINTGYDLETDEMIGSVYQKVWDSTILKEGEPEWMGEDSINTYTHGQLMVATYHEQVSPTVKPIAVETRFEERVKGVPIKIVGFVDVEEKDKLLERKTSKTKLSKPKSKWVLQGQLYSMIFAKPLEWQIITRQVTPQVVTGATESALRLENVNPDGVINTVQWAIEMINDFYARYGEDSPWPTLGIASDWLCGWCSWGPKYAKSCIAWRDND